MSLRHLPNLICAVRIVLVAPVVWYLLQGDHATALILFFIAGFSDGLDGFLARTFDWRSRLGSILDPLADKLLMISVFLTLTYVGLSPAWLAAVVVARDLVIVSGGFVYHFAYSPVEGEPSVVSKLNTGLQVLYVFLVVASAAYPIIPAWLVLLLGSTVFVTSVISGLDYVWVWGLRAHRLRQQRQ